MIIYPLTFDRKGKFFVAINPLNYIKESRAELAKVVWLSRNETFKLTLLVIFVSLVIGAYIAGLDTFFTILVEKFLIEK